MSIPIIKLLCDGELEEVNINCKKKENYNLNNFLKKINLEEEVYFSELHSWDLDQKKKLILIGSTISQDDGMENLHQLPIKEEYQYYDNLYVIITQDNKYSPLDLEIFENIYNALYLKMEDMSEDSDSLFSSDEEDLEEKNQEEDDDNENIIEDYGDGGEDSMQEEEEEENDIEVEEKKKKTVKRKKIIKIPETTAQDILKEEDVVQELTETSRIKCLEILCSVIPKITKNDREYMKNLERCVFNYSLQKSIERNIIPTWNIVFKNIYLNKVISLYSNISKNNYINNKRLITRIKKREFTPEQLVNMTPQELFPEHWKELIDEKYRRDKILYETKKEAMTDQFKCSKCHSRETCYFEMQTRSADEPMTIFITCLNCGKRWKN